MNKINKLISVGVLSTFLLVSQAGVALAAQKYIVKKGDSLYVIGKRFKVSIAEIQQTNKLKSINLSLGQILYIPTKGQVSPPASPSQSSNLKYTVVKGDSLYLLSKRFKVTAEAINKANNLKSINLSIGQVLIIPTAQRTTAVQPTPSRGSSDSNVGMLLEWSAADKLFPVDASVKVIDLVTGLTFRVSRLYGHNHADVEPVTAVDTATMKKAWGGVWSWDRRPVLVELNGRLVAASMNGMPHGQEKIRDNDMNGQVCMHFLNSRTHGSNKVDPQHQAAIRKAAGQK